MAREGGDGGALNIGCHLNCSRAINGYSFLGQLLHEYHTQIYLTPGFRSILPCFLLSHLSNFCAKWSV